VLDNSVEFRRIGEEVILDKIRSIFDELAPPVVAAEPPKRPFDLGSS
jgi:hypothetical protein